MLHLQIFFCRNEGIMLVHCVGTIDLRVVFVRVSFSCACHRLQNNLVLNLRKSNPGTAKWPLLLQLHHVLNSEAQAYFRSLGHLSPVWLLSPWSKMLLGLLPSVHHNDRYAFIKLSIVAQGYIAFLCPHNSTSTQIYQSFVENSSDATLLIKIFLSFAYCPHWCTPECPLSWNRG